MVTESAELVDQLKKHVFYGKPLDVVNLAEEGGDLFWYMALLCDELETKYDIPAQEIFNKNIAKLKARYPEKFTGEQAINRDVEAERVILEAVAIPVIHIQVDDKKENGDVSEFIFTKITEVLKQI